MGKVYIVTGEGQTGSKHYFKLGAALAYIKKLMEAGYGASISVRGQK